MGSASRTSRSTRNPLAVVFPKVGEIASCCSNVDDGDWLAQRLIDELGEEEARWFADHLGDLEWALSDRLRELEAEREVPYPARSESTVEEFTTSGGCYRLEFRQCGKKRCKCFAGDWHGPYWYAYRRKKGRVSSEYIGKTLSGVDGAARRRAEDRWSSMTPTAATKPKRKRTKKRATKRAR